MSGLSSLAWRRQTILPGFPLALGIVLPFLLFVIVVPVVSMVAFGVRLDAGRLWEALLVERVQAALWLSFRSSLIAACVATPVGLLLAWVFQRYDFWGRALLDALVDVPFALPTAVTGISLAYLYGPEGPMGQLLAPLGVSLAFQQGGILLALVLVSLPFAVRSVQPVIATLAADREDAAATLGASSWTIFWRVSFPQLRLALLTGFTLSFARGVGEYGSVIFIAGNRPFRTEVAPLLIITRLEEYDYVAAFAIALAMMGLSLLVLLPMAWMQRRQREEVGHG